MLLITAGFTIFFGLMKVPIPPEKIA